MQAHHDNQYSKYLLYHSIGMYPGKEQDLAATMADYARAWAAPDDNQWGYLLQKRQEFLGHWARMINVPMDTVTTAESVTHGVHMLMRSLPESALKGRRVLITADCFPSVHYLLSGLSSKIGFKLETVPLSEGQPWVETEDILERWGPDVAIGLITWVTSIASSRVDIAALASHARAVGSLTCVDITQASGLLPFDAAGLGIDSVVSTSLKWIGGTPGAGILHVNATVLAEQKLEPEARGWFSQPDPFSWDLKSFSFAPDIRRFDSGTPSAVAALASLPALKWLASQDPAAAPDWNRNLTTRIIEEADALGLSLHSPRSADRRGGSVMLKLRDAGEASQVIASLRAAGYALDARGSVLRMSPGAVTHQDSISGVFEVIAKVTQKSRKPDRDRQANAVHRKGEGSVSNDDYNNMGFIPGASEYPARWAADAEAFRRGLEPADRAQLDVPYGPRPRQRFDLFLPAGKPRGVIVFIHGGFWRSFDKSYWSHLAKGGTDAGHAVAIPSYTLAPEERVSGITREVAQALASIAASVAGDIRLVGHSAGGHLVLRLLCADAQISPDVRARMKCVLAISPIADLRPLIDLDVNMDLKLDNAEAQTESPILQPPPGGIALTLWVGGDERPGFLDQAQGLAAAWNAMLEIEQGRHHLNVIDGLADVSSPLLNTILET